MLLAKLQGGPSGRLTNARLRRAMGAHAVNLRQTSQRRMRAVPTLKVREVGPRGHGAPLSVWQDRELGPRLCPPYRRAHSMRAADPASLEIWVGRFPAERSGWAKVIGWIAQLFINVTCIMGSRLLFDCSGWSFHWPPR